MTRFLNLLTFLLVLPINSQELADRPHPVRPEAWPHLVEAVELTGEPLELLASLLGHESDGGHPGMVRYCTKWRPIPRDKLRRWRCVAETDCRKNCTRAKVWNNRLDVGMWQLRDVPTTIVVRGTKHRTKGHSWLREYATWSKTPYNPRCALDPTCATKAFAAVVSYLELTYKPKACGMPGVDDHIASWLPYWSAGGRATDRRGCNKRQHHLETLQQFDLNWTNPDEVKRGAP